MKKLKVRKTRFSEKKLQGIIRQLALERVKVASDNLAISVGSKEFSKEEILKSIEQNDEVGRDFVEAQIGYLKALASGAIYKDEPDNGHNAA